MDRRRDIQVSLPGGCVDALGRVHREVELQPLSGYDEEFHVGDDLADETRCVTALLSRRVRRIGTIRRISREIVRRLLVADRQVLMLKLREATFGEQIRMHVHCPRDECRKKLTIRFSTRDIPVIGVADLKPSYSLKLSPQATPRLDRESDDREIGFRLPNGGDQEAVAPLLAHDPAQADLTLLERCIVNIGPVRDPDAQMVARLSILAREEIELKMQELAPKLELNMESACPECGQEYTLPFDPVRFLFAELRLGRARLYREVHALASRYHWGEREIMNMPRPKRQTYLGMLSSEGDRRPDAA